MNRGLIKNYTAGAAIAAYRIVKPGAADGYVVAAAAATDKLKGVTTNVGADAADERIDVILGGIAEVEFGDDVLMDDPLTADADGKAVPADPAEGVNNRIIGFAEIGGADGDIGLVRLAPGLIQGEA